MLTARSRDVEPVDWVLSFADGRWTRLGDAAQVRMNEEWKEALDALGEIDGWATAAQVAEAVGKTRDATRKMLDRMCLAGTVERQVGRGLYRAARGEERQDKFDGVADREQRRPPRGVPGGGDGATDEAPF